MTVITFNGKYPPFTLDPNTGGILMTADNFTPVTSASLAVTSSSASVTFSPVSPSLRQSTFKITNTGSHGAYIGWGVGSATAVVATGTPAANCDYIAAGAIITQDFQSDSGIVDTIAAIRDGADTTLQITIGYGQ